MEQPLLKEIEISLSKETKKWLHELPQGYYCKDTEITVIVLATDYLEAEFEESTLVLNMMDQTLQCSTDTSMSILYTLSEIREAYAHRDNPKYVKAITFTQSFDQTGERVLSVTLSPLLWSRIMDENFALSDVSIDDDGYLYIGRWVDDDEESKKLVVRLGDVEYSFYQPSFTITKRLGVSITEYGLWLMLLASLRDRNTKETHYSEKPLSDVFSVVYDPKFKSTIISIPKDMYEYVMRKELVILDSFMIAKAKWEPSLTNSTLFINQPNLTFHHESNVDRSEILTKSFELLLQRMKNEQVLKDGVKLADKQNRVIEAKMGGGAKPVETICI